MTQETLKKANSLNDNIKLLREEIKKWENYRGWFEVKVITKNGDKDSIDTNLLGDFGLFRLSTITNMQECIRTLEKELENL